MIDPVELGARLERMLASVQKPGRYTGGEWNQVVKDWHSVRTRVALVFPDIYDLGMSNLGLAILYETLNQRPDVLAERAYVPWTDMEAALRAAGLPLYSLESKRPLAEFDILGFSLPYESLYTNVLNALHLAGVPLFGSERQEGHPLVIAGGHATFNPEPMHAFIDAFVIGEGEEAILEVVETHQDWQESRGSRVELLRALARLPGVYVPSLYRARYQEDGAFAGLERLWSQAPLPVRKRIVPRLPPPATRFVVPYVETVHDRATIEIMRGCTRGCRFCHAGMVTRPVRERPLEEILQAIEAITAHTGFEEVSLVSLSSSDYTQVVELVHAIDNRFAGRHLAISLPSLRLETVSLDLVQALTRERRTGFTLAPEASTERMRRAINKPASDEQLFQAARAIYASGWPTLKLYFMIGLPGETREDVEAIAELCRQVLAEGRRLAGRRASLHAGVSSFVPKPHTPFQWVPCDTLASLRAKQALLRRRLQGAGLKATWTRPEETLLEAWLARGDRRISEVIYGAWRGGARFDAWKEHLRFDAWLAAFGAAGLKPDFYAHRPRPLDESFPWEHIDAGLRREFLLKEYRMSEQGQPRADCRQVCHACGILAAFASLRRQNPGVPWKCPETARRRRAKGASRTNASPAGRAAGQGE